MADAFLETTEWAETFQPNHTYLMEGDKVFAYIKKGDTAPFYFSKTWNIDKRRRKFVKLDVNPFAAIAADPVLIEVEGSKGNKYYVDPVEKTCSCPGYVFRGKCKHLELIK